MWFLVGFLDTRFLFFFGYNKGRMGRFREGLVRFFFLVGICYRRVFSCVELVNGG